jgi:thiamine biosynthesis lipoprotein
MTPRSSRPELCRRARPLLGTLVEIAASGSSFVGAVAAVEVAFAVVQEVHRLMSFHELESDVSRINIARARETVVVSPHTHRVLRFARKLSAASSGVFDVTIGDTLVRHGFLPAGAAEESRPREATWRDLELLAGNGVRWRRAGRIDLGGIAKGYAVDMAIEALQSCGATSGLVNAGGDLRMFGEPQPVHVRLPDAPGMLAPLGLFADCALATSGAYFSSVHTDDGPVEPLVDRERRIVGARQGSATVVAAQCMTADALTKVVRLAPHLAPRVLDSFGARAIVIDGTPRRSNCATRCDKGVRLENDSGFEQNV